MGVEKCYFYGEKKILNLYGLKITNPWDKFNFVESSLKNNKISMKKIGNIVSPKSS